MANGADYPDHGSHNWDDDLKVYIDKGDEGNGGGELQPSPDVPVQVFSTTDNGLKGGLLLSFDTGLPVEYGWQLIANDEGGVVLRYLNDDGSFESGVLTITQDGFEVYGFPYFNRPITAEGGLTAKGTDDNDFAGAAFVIERRENPDGGGVAFAPYLVQDSGINIHGVMIGAFNTDDGAYIPMMKIGYTSRDDYGTESNYPITARGHSLGMPAKFDYLANAESFPAGATLVTQNYATGLTHYVKVGESGEGYWIAKGDTGWWDITRLYPNASGTGNPSFDGLNEMVLVRRIDNKVTVAINWAGNDGVDVLAVLKRGSGDQYSLVPMGFRPSQYSAMQTARALDENYAFRDLAVSYGGIDSNNTWDGPSGKILFAQFEYITDDPYPATINGTRVGP